MNHSYRSTLKINILFSTFTALMLNQLCTANANADENTWQFHLDPVPMLIMTGDRLKDSTLALKVNEECNGVMVAFFPSGNEKNLEELKGEEIPVSFGVNVEDERVEVVEKLELHTVIGSDELEEEASAVFRVFEFEHINELKGTPANPVSFYIKANDRKLFDMPYESWSFNGFEIALEEAINWCAKISTSEADFQQPQLLFI